jgi:hypothetical protein
MFTQSEQETSSTYRELLAIQLAIQAFEPLLLTGCKAKLFTDSQVAMKTAQVGSMKLAYHELAISIFYTCFRANIQLDCSGYREIGVSKPKLKPKLKRWIFLFLFLLKIKLYS